MKALLNNANKLDKIVATSYLSACAMTAISYDFSPIIKNIWYCEIFGADYSYDMPMKSAYFYDATKSPWYEISYTFFFVASFVIVLLTVSNNFLYNLGFWY
jgi:hypothetical protein